MTNVPQASVNILPAAPNGRDSLRRPLPSRWVCALPSRRPRSPIPHPRPRSAERAQRADVRIARPTDQAAKRLHERPVWLRRKRAREERTSGCVVVVVVPVVLKRDEA